MEVKLPPIILDEGTGSSMLIIGSSKSGKTTLMVEIVKKLYDDKKYITTLFAGNPQIEEYSHFSRVLMTAGFGKPHEQYIKSQQFVNSKVDNKYQFCNIFDDQIDLRYSKLLANLVLSYRNSMMSTIICLQSPKILTPACRSNMNNLICLWFNSEEIVTQILQIFIGDYFRRLGFHRQDWVGRYRQMTRNHNYLYLHILSETLWSSVHGYLIKDGVVVKRL
jgi:hypothetical protein